MTTDKNLEAALEIATNNAIAAVDQIPNYDSRAASIAGHAINVIDTLVEQGLERGYRERAMAAFMTEVERLTARRRNAKRRGEYSRQAF